MASDYAMSQPAFVPERHEIWYSDGVSGFYALRVDPSVWPGNNAPGGQAAVNGCRDHRHFIVPLLYRRRGRVVIATIYINGRRGTSRHGHDLRRVDLGHLPSGTYTVVVKARTSRRITITSTRRYRGCTQTKRRQRVHTKRHRRHRR